LRFTASILAEQAARIARLGLGFTPEDRRIFADLTVMENLDVGASARASLPTARGAGVRLLKRSSRCFPNPARCPTAHGGGMSGGEKQEA